jgi:hypothetical protein
LQENLVNVVGIDPDTGFARRPIDNVGVQYGLAALRAGQITVDDFLELNRQIGGFDIDGNWQPERSSMTDDLAALMYEIGAVNGRGAADLTPLVDVRIDVDVVPVLGFHDQHRPYSFQERLDRTFGTHASQEIWNGVALPSDALTQADAWATALRGLTAEERAAAMDKWLTAVERDRSSTPLAAKIVRDRPKDLQDRCTLNGWDDSDTSVAGQLCASPAFSTLYSTPRSVAGEDIANDTQKCALKPLRAQDYYPIQFDAAQWATLRSVFPTGVCDWTKPGPGQVGATPWMTYQDDNGKVVYGGRPIGSAPASSGVGWTNGSFDSWTRPRG